MVGVAYITLYINKNNKKIISMEESYTSFSSPALLTIIYFMNWHYEISDQHGINCPESLTPSIYTQHILA